MEQEKGKCFNLVKAQQKYTAVRSKSDLPPTKIEAGSLIRFFCGINFKSPLYQIYGTRKGKTLQFGEGPTEVYGRTK